jgi:glutamine cyclotransferase
VTATIDASGLLAAAERQGIDVLNGIAYDPADQTFLITGKLWPKLFRVKFVP